MIKGNLVSLFAVENEDLLQLKNWRNNPDFRKYFREHRDLNMRQQEIWFDNQVVKDNTTLMFSIKRNSDNQLLGCCGFVYINWIHKHADLSLYIGWKDQYIDEEGYAKDSCEILLKYGYDELGLNKVWTEIYDFDTKKKSLYDDLGFKQDGLLRQSYWYNGEWSNSLILSKLSTDS